MQNQSSMLDRDTLVRIVHTSAFLNMYVWPIERINYPPVRKLFSSSRSAQPLFEDFVVLKPFPQRVSV